MSGPNLIPLTADTVKRGHLDEVLQVAHARGDANLAAACLRAIDGDSLYHRDLLTLCARAWNKIHGVDGGEA